MKSIKIIAAAIMLLFINSIIVSQTIVPLNTGYNHSVYAAYPAVIVTNSTTKDYYWINISSYPTTSPAIAEAWVLKITGAPWQPAMSSTNWISARKNTSNAPGTSVENPSYTIFRKCFCLMQNYTQPKLSFKVRADDKIQVWFNTMTNVALASSIGNWNSTSPLSSLPSNANWFHAGKNCIYVLLEDQGGHMGFDLQGTIEANGLLPLPASGVAQTFKPCDCNSHAVSKEKAKFEDEDQKTISEIIKLAESHRAKKSK